MNTVSRFGAAAIMMAAACAPTPEPAPTKSGGLTDPQIAAIVVAANQVDAELGDVAFERATNPAIKQFGKTMATDHRAVNQAATELVTRLGVSPVESPVSRQLRDDGNAFRAKLVAMTGADFDRSYIEHEVAYHTAVIDAVDQALIPNASNAELKQTIITVRPALVAHLEHAKKLLAEMK